MLFLPLTSGRNGLRYSRQPIFKDIYWLNIIATSRILYDFIYKSNKFKKGIRIYDRSAHIGMILIQQSKRLAIEAIPSFLF